MHHLSLIIVLFFLLLFFSLVVVVRIPFCLQGPEQIHVSKFYKESKNGKFVSYITENVRTLYQTFREGAYASNNGPCLGWRETLTSPYQVRVVQYHIFLFFIVVTFLSVDQLR